MATIPPYRDSKLPRPFLNWIEQFREIFRPVPTFLRGTGSPEGVQRGNLGDRYFRTDGSPGTFLYVKTTDGGDTGWIAYG